MVIPREPGGRITEDRRTVLLQHDQIFQRIHPGIEAGGNKAGEHTGDVGAMLRGVKETVFPLPNDELQGALHDIGVEWRPLNL